MDNFAESLQRILASALLHRARQAIDRSGHRTRAGDAGGPPVELLIITLAMMIFTLIALAVLAVNVFQAMDSVF